jgi:hypothetical protein
VLWAVFWTGRHITETLKNRGDIEWRLIEGKTKREALRCLNRHLVRIIFNTMTNNDREAPAPALALT